MQFLTFPQCAAWCESHGYPTLQRPGYQVGPTPDLAPPGFEWVDCPMPKDSGRKVSLARTLYSMLNSQPELLVWLGDWEVWPSSQHMPLFTRFREALGETRPLIEAPGQLAAAQESDDAVSILAVSLFFFWDCTVLEASGRAFVHISHDEFVSFASRDAARVEEASALILPYQT